ncbi:MAG TPA: serine--tRNA ligase, partial [Ignavibacteria bacterium]
MLDIKLIRENPELVKKGLVKKGIKAESVDKILQLDGKRREIIQEVEKLKSLRNKVSQDVAKMKKEGKDASSTIAEMKQVSDNIKLKDENLSEIEKEINNALIDIPNLPDDSVPIGNSADENVQFKIWGEKPTGDFKFLDHVELGKKLDILDFGVGAKISGSGFPFYKGKGAILERALINFMLDSHKANGYTEVYVPFLVNRDSMEAAEK